MREDRPRRHQGSRGDGVAAADADHSMQQAPSCLQNQEAAVPTASDWCDEAVMRRNGRVNPFTTMRSGIGITEERHDLGGNGCNKD